MTMGGWMAWQYRRYRRIMCIHVMSDRRPKCQADSVDGFMRVTNFNQFGLTNVNFGCPAHIVTVFIVSIIILYDSSDKLKL